MKKKWFKQKPRRVPSWEELERVQQIYPTRILRFGAGREATKGFPVPQKKWDPDYRQPDY